MLDTLLDSHQLNILVRLGASVIAGGLIGLERSYHGRPAGFRTHTLVCAASTLLMLLSVYQSIWLPDATGETVRTDPVRMAQGIMTGIGFLGAGVIYKENFGVTGLTTAASIWITAAIGILIGAGFYFPAGAGFVMTLLVLSVFRRIEAKMPSISYAHFQIRFDRDGTISEQTLRDMLKAKKFEVAAMSYRLVDNGDYYEYRAVIRTFQPHNMCELAEELRTHPRVREFRVSPTTE